MHARGHSGERQRRRRAQVERGLRTWAQGMRWWPRPSLPRGRVCAVRSQTARMGRPLQAMGLPAPQGTASCLPTRLLSGVTLDWIGAARVGRRCRESCPAYVGCTLGSGLAGPTAGGHARWVPRI